MSYAFRRNTSKTLLDFYDFFCYNKFTEKKRGNSNVKSVLH